ncbi:VCBS repeat-containing protein [Aestuariivivens marinum]|uniref:VCBS repeat-containing protein n=1 Tax=Aestuariivivens marinum TaxID=2913555 RepID=UPI001F5AFBD4|nr:VCBS repeat-containing protein [Aestuariivivens marinum]
MRIYLISISTLCLALVYSCKKEINKQNLNELNETGKHLPDMANQPLFKMLNPFETGIKFVNSLTETPDMNGFFYEYYYNGAGVSIADINNDGLLDLLFISNLWKNHLYLNEGHLKFKDITEASGMFESKGFRTGVTNVDINNDGLMDFYISKSGKYDDPTKRQNELWVNQGPNQHGIPTFKEQAAQYNLAVDMCSTQAAFFDYDLDGDLDMFLINHYTSPLKYSETDKMIKTKGILTGDRLYQNRKGKFFDVTEMAGITNINRLSYGLGVSIGDVNNDGWPDVYVANDYEGKDFLYLNNKNGTFTDIANTSTAHVSFYSMGTDMADINNDGWMDFMSLDMMAVDNYTIKTSMSAMNTQKFYDVVEMGLHHQYMYNALQINNGILKDNIPLFSDVAQLAGVASTDWSWGPLIFDMDNDGQQDIFVSNGIKKDFRNNDFVIKQKTRKDKIKPEDRDAFINSVLDEMPARKKQNYFFKNNGSLSFSDKSDIWVSDILTSSNGAAYGDLDNDGDLDIVVNNADDVSLIYKNHAAELELGNYLKVDFKGGPENTKGIGVRVKVQAGQNIQTREHYLTRGFQSSIASGLHFGIGKAKVLDTVQVTWPDGKEQILEQVESNQTIVLNYTNASKSEVSDATTKDRLFFELGTEQLGLDYKHQENDFDDFKRESLIPHKMSQQGPAIAVGDFNGDGLEDVYFGAALGQKSMLYKQTEESKFVAVQEETFLNQAKHEDTDAVFFDADNDGDLDLYVVSGGNEKELESNYYNDNFYVNNNGAFSKQNKSIPAFNISGACVRPFDYDNDGDLDLFIGGRQTPGEYPKPTSSVLLRNDSNKGEIAFTDITNEVCPELINIGMVTDVINADLNNDGLQDLIIVGEWMQVRVFYNLRNTFVDKTEDSGLKETTGWWNTIKVADVDADGDLDLLAGNLGLNYKYKATNDKPFKIYANDFDETGTLDIVLGYYQGDDLFPLRGRQCSSQQMPFIKKKFKTYDEFGKASLIDVYGETNLEQAISYGVQTFASTYFENTGDGKFVAHVFENLAQISSINDMVIEDFNGDGNLDIIAAGNLYNAEVETPRNDASYGLYMQGDGKGNFKSLMPYESGIYSIGEVRHIKKINISNKSSYIFAINNNTPIVISNK